MDPTAILLGNFTAALEQVNRYLAVGLGTAVAVLLIELSTAASARAEITLAGVPVPVTLDTAKQVLLGAYFVAGIMAYVATLSAAESATMLVSVEAGMKSAAERSTLSLLVAACTYPSIATAEPLLRLPAVVLPAVFACVVVWRVYRRMERHIPGERGASYGMTAVAAWPYAALALAIRNVPC